ncbi:hypothetical protein, partial [Pseudomonas aeruginosa]
INLKQINLINRGDLKFIFFGYQKAEKYFFAPLLTLTKNNNFKILKLCRADLSTKNVIPFFTLTLLSVSFFEKSTKPHKTC